MLKSWGMQKRRMLHQRTHWNSLWLLSTVFPRQEILLGGKWLWREAELHLWQDWKLLCPGHYLWSLLRKWITNFLFQFLREVKVQNMGRTKGVQQFNKITINFLWFINSIIYLRNLVGHNWAKQPEIGSAGCRGVMINKTPVWRG